ncbi:MULTISPECIES: hypothetical protein [unclassified Sphingopyxis]|uniref:hypothetical protein n=1 Tax=Sphingopyxis sp. DBS4 TaxID=2968500 RepID=UPI00214B4862|nr:hypothetical protein [Sphingopyxis sp. DBS4]
MTMLEDRRGVRKRSRQAKAASRPARHLRVFAPNISVSRHSVGIVSQRNLKKRNEAGANLLLRNRKSES